LDEAISEFGPTIKLSRANLIISLNVHRSEGGKSERDLNSYLKHGRKISSNLFKKQGALQRYTREFFQVSIGSET
jgi:hypothetical protein